MPGHRKRTTTAPRLVERATALKDRVLHALRNQRVYAVSDTRMDIYEKDAEIPYVKFEAATATLSAP